MLPSDGLVMMYRLADVTRTAGLVEWRKGGEGW